MSASLDRTIKDAGSSAFVADEHDTTLGSNIANAWTETGSNASTNTINGQTITAGTDGVTWVQMSTGSAGIYKINVTISSITATAPAVIDMPWGGAGSMKMLLAQYYICLLLI